MLSLFTHFKLLASVEPQPWLKVCSFAEIQMIRLSAGLKKSLWARQYLARLLMSNMFRTVRACHLCYFRRISECKYVNNTEIYLDQHPTVSLVFAAPFVLSKKSCLPATRQHSLGALGKTSIRSLRGILCLSLKSPLPTPSASVVCVSEMEANSPLSSVCHGWHTPQRYARQTDR